METYCLREASTLARMSGETRLAATGVVLTMGTQSLLSLLMCQSLFSVSNSV